MYGPVHPFLLHFQILNSYRFISIIHISLILRQICLYQNLDSGSVGKCRGKTWGTSKWTLVRVDLYRADQGHTMYTTTNEQLSSHFW